MAERNGSGASLADFFYKYQPARKPDDIDVEMKQLEAKIAALPGAGTE